MSFRKDDGTALWAIEKVEYDTNINKALALDLMELHFRTGLSLADKDWNGNSHAREFVQRYFPEFIPVAEGEWYWDGTDNGFAHQYDHGEHTVYYRSYKNGTLYTHEEFMAIFVDTE